MPSLFPIQNGYQLMLTYFEKSIIPDASAKERGEIEALVEKCVAAKGGECSEAEAEIDARVTSLYGL